MGGKDRKAGPGAATPFESDTDTRVNKFIYFIRVCVFTYKYACTMLIYTQTEP